MNNNYQDLKLENQLCFPLYACSKEIVRKYTPYLSELDLTYTQYIAMMVLWECNTISVKELGERLYLDSGTLTPLLKKLESKNYIKRQRNSKDERIVQISITENALKLREQAADIPQKVGSCIKLSEPEAAALYSLLYKTLDGLRG